MADQRLDRNPINLMPALLKAGDRVRFVSPASTPDKEAVFHAAAILESWDLVVEIGHHAFKEYGFLAGRDEHRLADVNDALRDPSIRAIFATRGGKGSYRIADKLDFGAVRADPKFLIGFSDITILHLVLWDRCKLVGVHGALFGVGAKLRNETSDALRGALMSAEPIVLHARPEEQTSALTRGGQASGTLLGGNLDMIATASGWALPDLTGALLLVEAVNMGLGQVDRALTMLVNSGHLKGLNGVAVGQFTGFNSHGDWSVIDVLRHHFTGLDVPVLGGLPIGHGSLPRTVLVGAMVHMDASDGTLVLTANEAAGAGAG